MAGKIIADFMFGVGQVITGLVNDLVTGGTDKALSAEQGKVLNDKMFGVGQTVQDVKASRALGVTYTNTTGKLILVMVSTVITSGGTPVVSIDGQPSYYFATTSATSGYICAGLFPVPAGSTYSVSQANASISHWRELR